MNSWCSRWALFTSATVGARCRPGRRSRRVVHAQLDHADLVPGAQAQQRERQADVVVQVALRREVLSGCQARRMDATICVTVVLPLLPVTAISGSGNWLAPGFRQLAQRGLLSPLRCRASRRAAARLRDGGDRALVARLGDEVVGVEALAAQRDEQVAGLQRAGVGVHALRSRPAVADERPPVQAAACWRVNMGAHARASSARRACAWSENGASRPRSPGSPRGPCRPAGSRPAARRRPRSRRWRGRGRPAPHALGGATGPAGSG
jgi:hypothetical protein